MTACVVGTATHAPTAVGLSACDVGAGAHAPTAAGGGAVELTACVACVGGIGAHAPAADADVSLTEEFISAISTSNCSRMSPCPLSRRTTLAEGTPVRQHVVMIHDMGVSGWR